MSITAKRRLKIRLSRMERSSTTEFKSTILKGLYKLLEKGIKMSTRYPRCLRKSLSRLVTRDFAKDGSTTYLWFFTRWANPFFLVISQIAQRQILLGPASMDHLPCRSCSFQNPARCIPKDGNGVGGPWRLGYPLTP